MSTSKCLASYLEHNAANRWAPYAWPAEISLDILEKSIIRLFWATLYHKSKENIDLLAWFGMIDLVNGLNKQWKMLTAMQGASFS